MGNAKPGLSLLRTAFGAADFDRSFLSENKVGISSLEKTNVLRLGGLPNLNDELQPGSFEWPGLQDLEDDSDRGREIYKIASEVEELVGRHGIDILAWYQPYRAFGEENWGVYFDVAKIEKLCIAIWVRNAGARSSIHFENLFAFVIHKIARHELEHAHQELQLAEAVSMGLSDANKPPSIFKSSGTFRETLATQSEMFESNEFFPRQSKYLEEFWSHVWRRRNLPVPYNDFGTRDRGALLDDFAKTIGHTSQQNMTDYSLLTKGKLRSRFVDIPLYVWFNPGKTSGSMMAFAKIAKIDCRKFVRFLKKKTAKTVFGPGYEYTSDTRHPNAIQMNGNRTIPISCHDWDKIPDHVIGQIADQIELSRSEVIGKILRNI